MFYFDKGIAIEEKESLLYCSKGNILFRMQRYNGALDALNKAIALDKNCLEAWNGLGNTYEKLKLYEDAI